MNFSKIVKLVIGLIKNKFKQKTLEASDATEYAFKTLKATFTLALILRHFHSRLPTIIKNYMSHFEIKVILSQVENNYLNLIALHSRNMDMVEINNKIHNIEMLAINSIFKE
jgi:hypothetical protein